MFTAQDAALRHPPTNPVAHHWPQPPDQGLTRKQRVAAMRGFLAGGGHDPYDFEVELKPSSWLTGMLGLKHQFLTVRRHSSRREQVYSADAHSPWLAELLIDIDRGVFDK